MSYPWFLSVPHFSYSVHQQFYLKIFSGVLVLSAPNWAPWVGSTALFCLPASTVLSAVSSLIPSPHSITSSPCHSAVPPCLELSLFTRAVRAPCGFVSLPPEPPSFPLSPCSPSSSHSVLPSVPGTRQAPPFPKTFSPDVLSAMAAPSFPSGLLISVKVSPQQGHS